MTRIDEVEAQGTRVLSDVGIKKGNRMKKWIICLFAGALISGCSTIPSTPKPHPEKYTFKIIGVEIPEITFQTPDAEICDPLWEIENPELGFRPVPLGSPLPPAETIINNPNAKIITDTIVIAGLGESVTNDQTKAVSLPESWEVVDGKVIVKEKMIKLGDSVAITVDKIENGEISYHLNARYNKSVGFTEYPMEKGSSVKMPVFKNRSIDTNLKQAPNSWIGLGCLSSKNSDGEKITFMMCVRVISPKEI
jgi:hypothetical protein